MTRLQFLTLILLASQHLINCNNPLNCNPNSESLFVEDPTDRQAFFSCKPYVNYPSIGFWSRHYCPNDMHFEYSSQQCTTDSLPPNTVREANDLLQLAILNGSCAHGEQCIGGTVCDPVQQRCLCPYGTVVLLENLFCAKLIPPVGTTLQQQFSYGGQYYSSQVPLSSQGTSTSSPLNSLVPIGSYCDQEGTCDGGSTCVNSVCVCPAKTKNNGNNCTTSLSNFSNIPSSTSGQQQLTKELFGQKTFFRAKLGEQCNEYLGLFCADQSSLCFNGYCQCIPPMIEQQGQCQMPPTREAGPGELCNSGQVCVGGSVCNQQVPLCVCPKETELVKGRCVERNLERASKEEKIEEKLSSSSTESTYSNQNKLRPSKIEAKVGEKCSLNADCASGAYCNGNTQPPTCQCLSTHISVHDHCEKVIYPGQKGCETDLQCSAGYAGARCLNGHCVCPPGSSALEQTCIPAIAWPGEACNISHLIPVCSADSYCFEGFCVCNPPLSLFQKQCINLKKNFEEENKKEERIKVKRRRLHLEEFGGNFNRKMLKNEVLRNKVEEKNGKNLSKNSSLKGKTKNSSKRIFKKSKRRRKRKLREEKEQQQKQNEKKRKAVPKISPTFRLIGSKCNENIDHCSAGADCLNSKCVCLEGSFPDTQKRYCRQYPGKSCAKGQMCTDRSDCIFGKCKCRRGLELQIFGNISKCGESKKNNGKMPLAGHLCANNECTPGAKCQNGICTCLEGYNLFHGECLPPRASLSGTNTFHEHSLLFFPNFPLMDSSTFEIKYKERKDDLSEEDPLPTKTVVAGAPCRLSLECPYRTECLRGVCRCKQGETIINGVCRKAIHEVLPGGRCDTQNGVDCIGESHCFYGICVCLYGLVITGQECVNSSLMKAVRPGGRCILGQRCTGRSRCVRSICQCPQFVFFLIFGG
uniref:EGF-like domain-containing protein n=2 Tax=Meloidogyne enterolobii TaxID=390850 RepID=A0A6V7X8V3_MELEN|nr:unnamed protein product [Meloidogyne enterolobii]